MEWNVRGWTNENKQLRESVINGESADIVVLVETHLSDNKTIEVTGYKSVTHNRKTRHIRAKVTFGGLCVLVSNGLYNEFRFEILDKTYEGIMVLKFTDRHTEYCFLLIAAYLPPEGSAWGRDAIGFYSHILGIIYQYSSECDTVYLTGDLNSRFGSEKDFIPGIDDVNNRHVIDNGKNKHGTALLNFLLESKMIVCNGRLNPEFDNFTFIDPARGSSVVDYFIVPNDAYHKCLEFKVKSAREMINKHCNLADVRVNLGNNIPDHSVLMLTIDVSYANEVHSESQAGDVNTFQSTHIGLAPDHVYFKRYNVSRIPEQFMNSDVSKNDMLEMIDNIVRCRAVKQELDDIYDDFCRFYHREMNNWFKCHNVHPTAQKKLKRCTKPFWNNELKALWVNLCKKEDLFLRSHGQNRNITRHKFKEAQTKFDRKYRTLERKYKRDTIIEIENISTTDPNKFWKTIKKLGPPKKSNIPLEVYNDDGHIENDLDKVLEQWKLEFQKLYTFLPEPGTFDDQFYDNCKQNLATIEQNGDILEGLNHIISIEEVEKVLSNSKSNKAVGIDNLPNEIFKGNTSTLSLTTLFNKILDTSITPSIWNLAIIKPIPKNSMIDPRLPLQYRGISLLSTVYKFYTSVLNTRLTNTAENENLFCDEQNGFRKKRSCADHVFSLTSVIRNRKNKKLPTFVAYVDLEKAFDRVDRTLLFYKLRQMGIGGKLYESIKTLYSDCQAAVNVNGYLTDKFQTDYGVRQGDALSPTLFGLFGY